MASPGGTSTDSSSLHRQSSSGSEQEDTQLIVDERKRKRMQSNRESARRSRMRKQKHLDDLMSQVTNLRKENGQLMTNMNVTAQHYSKIESENSVLRAQMDELRNRLDSLNEIIGVMNGGGGGDGNGVFGDEENLCGGGGGNSQFFGGTMVGGDGAGFINMNHWSSSTYFNQPITASPADILRY